MTTDPLPAADLAELRQAELARREERRIARESGAIPALRARRRGALARRAEPVVAGIPDGYEPAPAHVESTPRMSLSARATAALERAAAEAGDIGFVDEALVRAGRAADPEAALSADVLTLLSDTKPLPALRHLVELAACGLPVLGEDQRTRAEAVCSGRLPAPAVDPDEVDAWQLHLEAAEAFGHATLSTAAWQRLVERLPLSIVDDLIDRGSLRRHSTTHTWPTQSDRVRYVTARLSPEHLDDTELEALDWEDEECRRILRSGGGVHAIDGRHDQWSLRSALLAGDVSVLDDAEAFPDRMPEDLAGLVSSLQEVRRGGPVGRQLGQDRSLFGILEDCIPDGILVSGRTDFHYWAGTRRMHRLLDDVHWALACAPDRLQGALRATTQQALAVRNQESRGMAGKADREARVVQAYLCFLDAGPNDKDRFDRGIGLLEDVLKRGGSRRGGVDGEERRHMASLSELLQSLRRASKPQAVVNPYLALCVEHASTEWRQGWRDLRGQALPDQLEYVNGAKDRVQRIETARRLGREPETVYVLPMNERFLWVPGVRNQVLQPDPQPMQRRTGVSSEEEQQWTADEAAREIIGHRAAGSRNDR
ncbi:hypothetical protein ACFWXA_17225 [Streptomyces atroolivaceus]|uniref:hypothetical protein n=1 Tax=Streptomyces atroolivaceus TaxID=66869 RepID=UPI00366613AB